MCIRDSDLPSQGLYISSVEDYSDLNNHDITVGDVILTADGVTLETTSDLLDVLETHKPGETCLLYTSIAKQTVIFRRSWGVEWKSAFIK